jgi:hypothetical protein
MAAQIELSKSERTRAKPLAKRVGELSAKTPFAEELALSLALDAAMLGWQRRGQLGFFVPVEEWAQVLAAAVAAVKPNELIFPGVREARLAIFRGLPLTEYLRQHLGLDAPDSDPSQSQAGHAAPGTIASARYRVASAGGGAGAHLPHAVGAASAARTLKRSEAVLALAGSAATESDDCHVALNFAAVFRAPVVFLFRAERSTPADLMAAARGGKGPAILEVAPPTKQATELIGELGGPGALASAGLRCEDAFREALEGRRPGLGSMIHGVFAEPSWPLLAQARDLAGETVVAPEEV